MADRRLQVFHAVARHLSFTKAAEALFITQPAVTFQIRQLEAHFNAKLFERQHNRINLTPAGEVVLDYAERLLALSDEMEAFVVEMTGEIRGPLLIGASLTIAEYLLPPVLGAFKSAHSGVVPRLLVGNSETTVTRVREHYLDLGLIESPVQEKNLMTEVCCEDELVVVCAPDSELAAHKSLTLSQLEGLPYISREPGSGTRDFTDHYVKELDASPDILNQVMELGSPEAIKRIVASGLGFAIMSQAAVQQEIKLGSLLALPLKPRLTRELSIICPCEKYRSRLIEAFVQVTKESLAEG